MCDPVTWCVIWLPGVWSGYLMCDLVTCMVCDIVTWCVIWLPCVWSGSLVCDLVTWYVIWFPCVWSGYLVCDLVTWCVIWLPGVWSGSLDCVWFVIWTEIWPPSRQKQPLQVVRLCRFNLLLRQNRGFRRCSLGGEGVRGPHLPFRRMERKPGSLYTLCSLCNPCTGHLAVSRSSIRYLLCTVHVPNAFN